MIDISFYRYNDETGTVDCEFIGSCNNSHEIPKYGHRIKFLGKQWWVKDESSITFYNGVNDHVDVYLKEYK